MCARVCELVRVCVRVCAMVDVGNLLESHFDRTDFTNFLIKPNDSLTLFEYGADNDNLTGINKMFLSCK